jgi:hypothetical protein
MRVPYTTHTISYFSKNSLLIRHTLQFMKKPSPWTIRAAVDDAAMTVAELIVR